MAKPPPTPDRGVTPVQRQGYPSVNHLWKVAVRADFVPFGDRGSSIRGVEWR